MDELIRIDMPQKRRAAPLWIGAAIALTILIGAISLIWIARDSMDDDGRILLTGIAIISLLALMTFFVMSRTHSVTERRQVRQDTVYSSAFYNNVVPSLVITDGKPVVANKSYLDLKPPPQYFACTILRKVWMQQRKRSTSLRRKMN